MTTTLLPPAEPRVDDDARLASILRNALLGLCALGVVGTAIELAMLRHWVGGDQLIPWAALGGLAVALVAVVRSEDPRIVRLARLVALGVLLAALLGVLEHVHANYEAGPLDQEYSAKWDSMSFVARWWTAATGGVGPSPALAPLVLAQSAICLWLGTLGRGRLSA